MVNAVSPTEIRYAAPLFAALGDRTRLRLVVQLARDGRASIAQLSARSALSRQAITKHLAVLEGVGLARSERRGRERLWQLEAQRLADARAYLDLVSRQWDAALTRLKEYVEG